MFKINLLKIKDDRINDYQHYALDAVNTCAAYKDMGAQVHVDLHVYNIIECILIHTG